MLTEVPWTIHNLIMKMISYSYNYLDYQLVSGFRTRWSNFFLFAWYFQKATYNGSLHGFKKPLMTSGSFVFKIREAYSVLTLMPCELSGETGASSTWICSLVSCWISEDNSVAFFFCLSCLLLLFRYSFLFCLLCLPIYWYGQNNKRF